jgi:hypothetical protein
MLGVRLRENVRECEACWKDNFEPLLTVYPDDDALLGIRAALNGLQSSHDILDDQQKLCEGLVRDVSVQVHRLMSHSFGREVADYNTSCSMSFVWAMRLQI